tara:strand:- start:183 stop:332 length:150 start_codon:yes stop_codon:yes gene_type:complete
MGKKKSQKMKKKFSKKNQKNQNFEILVRKRIILKSLILGGIFCRQYVRP